MAENGPSGQHLIDLMRSSDEVLDAVLLMSGRHDLVIAKKLVDSKRVLLGMLKLIEELESLDKTRRPDPRDVIYAAIHSAFVKYPITVGGPSGPENWIPPSESAHLAGAVMMELEANGYKIERKD